jgi:hypothetical protein
VVTVIVAVVSPVLQSSVPVKFDAVSVDVPSQLSVTVTVGAAGALPGFATPLPGLEIHPTPRDCVTVYVPAVVTVIDGVVSPVLHNNVPVKFDAVSNDVPSQLSVTATVGAFGALPGFATPLPAADVHPAPRDCVTVYVPATVTVIGVVVAPVLHSIVAPATMPVAVSVDVPSQLSVTVTVGAAGALPGFAIPLPGLEIHAPPRDCVTVYVPAVVTVIDGVVSPVLHSKVPVKFDAVNIDVPSQLSVTVTVGAAGAIPGFATPLPGLDVHPAPRDCVTVYVPAVVTVIDGVVSPVLQSSVPVKFDAVSVDVPLQLSVTVTVGAAGALPGLAIPLPGLEVHPAPSDCVTV